MATLGAILGGFAAGYFLNGLFSRAFYTCQTGEPFYTKDQASLAEFYKRAKPGDLIFLEGIDPDSVLVQIGTNTNIHHVGVLCDISEVSGVIRNEKDKAELGVFHCTPNKGLVCILDSSHDQGAKLNRLGDFFNECDGYVYWRPLRNPLSEMQSTRLSTSILNRAGVTQYDKSSWTQMLLCTGLPLKRSEKQKLESATCAELIGHVLDDVFKDRIIANVRTIRLPIDLFKEFHEWYVQPKYIIFDYYF